MLGETLNSKCLSIADLKSIVDEYWPPYLGPVAEDQQIWYFLHADPPYGSTEVTCSD